jgi:hypothetical protein
MRRSRSLLVGFLAVAFGFLLPAATRAAEPFRFPEQKHGKGELKYINCLPVLTVEGTPEEIGEQIAVLAVKPGRRMLSYPQDVLRALLKAGLPAAVSDKMYQNLWQYFSRTAETMVQRFPSGYRKELESLIAASQLERTPIVVGNTMFDAKNVLFDLRQRFGCSVLLVEANRSATGSPLFGRNLDFPTAGYLEQYSLITAWRPADKHPFVSVGFPGLLGCLSGMNDAGLALAVLEVYTSKDESSSFDPEGLPYALCFRRLLEECTTIEEAETALRAMKRTTFMNLAVCDRQHAAVFEITPRNIIVRRPVDGLCPCTNHFRSKELATSVKCDRYDILSRCQETPKLDLGEIGRSLNAVSRKRDTLQTMIFDPRALRLHLAIGQCPSSALPLKTLDLAPLLKKG